MKITAFLKWLIGFDDEKPREEEKKEEGILLGEERRKLVLKSTHRMIESHPRARYAPVLKWEWTDSIKPFFLDIVNEVNPHINISGSSGYGKSTLCKCLLAGISKELRIPVIVLDVHNEFIDYVLRAGGRILSPQVAGLNIWELDGMSPAERIGENIEMLKRILDLGEIQAYTLVKCAENAYRRKGIINDDRLSWGRTPPTMRDVQESMETMLRSASMSKNQSLVGLSKRLYSILACSAFSGKTDVPFNEILSGTSSFTLGDLRSNEAQAMFIETFLRKLYAHMLSRNLERGTGLYILIDEAHKVCISNSKGMSLPGRLVTEGRKYGIGIITSNQMAKALDRSIVGNSAVTFAFHQKEPQEEEYIANLLSGGNEKGRKEEVRIALRYLRQFEAIVLTSKKRNPVKIRIRPAWEAATIANTLKTKTAVSAKPAYEKTTIISAPKPKAKTAKEHMQELRSLILGKLELRAYDVDELEEELGFGGDELEGIINSLEREGLVDYILFDGIGQGSACWVGKKSEGKSLEHSAYVAMIAKLLSETGIPRTVHDSMDMPDIVAEVNGKKIAIEYETGKKKDMNLVRKMLEQRAKEYQLVLVVMAKENVAKYMKVCMNAGANIVETGKIAEMMRRLLSTGNL